MRLESSRAVCIFTVVLRQYFFSCLCQNLCLLRAWSSKLLYFGDAGRLPAKAWNSGAVSTHDKLVEKNLGSLKLFHIYDQRNNRSAKVIGGWLGSSPIVLFKFNCAYFLVRKVPDGCVCGETREMPINSYFGLLCPVSFSVKWKEA